jgi:hypothetical protein
MDLRYFKFLEKTMPFINASKATKATKVLAATSAIGKTIEEAAIVLEKLGLTMRVMQRDGQHLVGTCDLRSNRISVAVTDNKVTSILGCG